MVKTVEPIETDELPRYRVLERSYIGLSLIEPGIEIVFDHDPGENLEPLNEAAHTRRQAYHTRLADEAKERGEKFRPPVGPNSPSFAYDLVRTNVQDGVAQGSGRAPGR